MFNSLLKSYLSLNLESYFRLGVGVLGLFVTACSSSSASDTEITLRDTQEVSTEDDAEILDYLKSHFYNYSDFEANLPEFNDKVIIDTIDASNSSKKSLYDFNFKTKNVIVDDVDHTMYYHMVREGKGENVKTADSVLMTYKGELLNREVFDVKIEPTWLDLIASIQGFRELLIESKASPSEYTVNEDGTISFDNDDYGIVIMVIPSRLAYFNVSLSGIPSYSPLTFTVQTYLRKETDHDGDGIISAMEDPDEDGNPRNDDTDEDGIPNYRDRDDDGDGTLTKKEYDENNDNIIDDRDKDGIPDYLDKI